MPLLMCMFVSASLHLSCVFGLSPAAVCQLSRGRSSCPFLTSRRSCPPVSCCVVKATMASKDARAKAALAAEKRAKEAKEEEERLARTTGGGEPLAGDGQCLAPVGEPVELGPRDGQCLARGSESKVASRTNTDEEASSSKNKIELKEKAKAFGRRVERKGNGKGGGSGSGDPGADGG